jgi:spermidine synthase
MKSLNLLASKKVITVSSFYNKEIQVVEFLGRKRLVAGGLLQSGGLVKAIWSKGLNYIKKLGLKPKTVLILGLGGGTAAKLLLKKIPKAFVTGVEIDEKMVSLGRKYLGLKKSKNLKIIIGDSFKIIDKFIKSRQNFDLILIDMYKGDKMPGELKKTSFLKKLKKLGGKNSLFVFNHLFYGREKQKAKGFVKRLEKVFSNISLVRTWSNLLIFSKL